MTADEYKYDFQTPPNVAALMASMIPEGAEKILEPTPGNGNLVKAILVEQQCREMINAECLAPEDYFLRREYILKTKFDCIVMNPPFSVATLIADNAPEIWRKEKGKDGMKAGYRMLLELLRQSDSVIALLPFSVLIDSDVRLRLLMKYGIKSITSLPRETFNYVRVQTVIIEFHRGYEGETVFKALDVKPGSKHNQPKLL